MHQPVSPDVMLANGTIIDGSIFNDENYVEVDEDWLQQARETLSLERTFESWATALNPKPQGARHEQHRTNRSL